jgi:hypothetical protein
MTRSIDISAYLSHFEASVKNIVIDNACFICPGGHYGQKIYYYLQHYHKNIIGFIDNDLSKQGKRVYGTSGHVFSPHILTSYNDKPVYVILYAGPYTGEIKRQLNTLHNSITYISL